MLNCRVNGNRLRAEKPEEMKYLLTTYMHGFDSPTESRFETRSEAIGSIPGNSRLSFLSKIEEVIFIEEA